MNNFKVITQERLSFKNFNIRDVDRALHYVVADTPSFAISRQPGFGFPITEGIPVSLKCDVDANPRAFPIWQKDESTPPVQQSPDGFLNFTEIRREHSGWYKCIARHQLGRFSSIGYFLNVRCKSKSTISEIKLSTTLKFQ